MQQLYGLFTLAAYVELMRFDLSVTQKFSYSLPTFRAEAARTALRPVTCWSNLSKLEAVGFEQNNPRYVGFSNAWGKVASSGLRNGRSNRQVDSIKLCANLKRGSRY